jgi:hypothetical protein
MSKNSTSNTTTQSSAAAATAPKIITTVKSTVGEKKNYNLAGYTQYKVATIEATTPVKGYRARIGFQGPEGIVFFNSDHQDLSDAERMVNFVREGKSNGRLYNIFGQTIDVHSSQIGPSTSVTTVEVLGLIYSFNLP